MNYTVVGKLQFWFLIFVSLLLLWASPDIFWGYNPDSGIYIGTAENLVNEGRYWFNGYPNLLYYPGTSGVLAAIIAVFGTDFHALHLFSAIMVIISLWLARIYFSEDRYGLLGLAVPLLMACTEFLLVQIFNIMSDGLFLAIVLAALLLWRVYAETTNRFALAACLIFVAFAPLVRFQGLFLCVAFAGALALEALRGRQISFRPTIAGLGIGLASFLPFAAWTWRNLTLHTLDTFNHSNGFFFGLYGLRSHAPGWGRVDWIDADWKYPVYQALFDGFELQSDLFGTFANIAQIRELVLAVLLGLVLAGALRWFRRATNMEWIFVGMLVSFMAYQYLIRSDTVYSPIRYWIPILPFVLISGAMGLSIIHDRLARTRARLVVGIVSVLLLMSALYNGATFLIEETGDDRTETFRNSERLVAELSGFVDQHTKRDDNIATSDWGILPRALNRQSYMILNDDPYTLSLDRMHKYQTKYLVILQNNATRTLFAQRMADELPNLFTKELEIKSVGPGPSGLVYAVDLAKVKAFLATRDAGSADAGEVHTRPEL